MILRILPLYSLKVVTVSHFCVCVLLLFISALYVYMYCVFAVLLYAYRVINERKKDIPEYIPIFLHTKQ